jgi:hypothetical protein
MEQAMLGHGAGQQKAEKAILGLEVAEKVALN